MQEITPEDGGGLQTMATVFFCIHHPWLKNGVKKHTQTEVPVWVEFFFNQSEKLTF